VAKNPETIHKMHTSNRIRGEIIMRKVAAIIGSALKCEDGMKNKELITIDRFNSLLDAYLVASRIESKGIECFLPSEMLANSSHNHFIRTSRIKLQVRREDAIKALKILNAAPLDTFDDVFIGAPMKCETVT
jgi:hypothetical protein